MSTKPSSRSRSTIQSVGRALDLLDALRERDEIGLVDLAQATGLLPSTAHRLLATLAERGYVVQNPLTGRYLLGYKLLELGSHVARRAGLLRALARPHLEKVRQATRETTNLVLLNGSRSVYIDQVEGVHAVRMFAALGGDFPAHTTGAGKAILAFSDAAVVARVTEDPAFGVRLTEKTLANRPALEADLARIRKRGYAIDDEEHEEGVTCVATPVLGHDGRPCAALSVSGPSARLRRTGITTIAALLQREAEDLARELGYDGV